MKKQKILYVDIPFLGFKGGDKNRSNFLFKALNSSYEVDVLLIEDRTYTKAELERHKKSNRAFTIKSKPSGFFRCKALFDFSNQSLQGFKKLIIKEDYDVVFFRYCSTSKLACIVQESLPFSKVIIDVDMLFSRINKEAWSSNRSLKNRYYFFESIKSDLFERDFFKKDFIFLYTNKEEISYVQKNYKGINKVNHKHLPNVITKIEKTKKIGFKKRTILFFGSLNSTANETAYEYLVTEIYPLIKEKLIENGISIKVVGKNRTKIYDNAPVNIEIVGEVEDINAYIKSSDLVFLPLKVASGTRTRILEASNLKKAVLCTSIAAEGLDMYDKLFIEDDTKKLALKLLELVQDRELLDEFALNAYNFVQENYLDENVGKKLNTIIDEFTKEVNVVHIPRRFTQKSWGGTENVIVSHLKNLKEFSINSEVYTSTILESKKEQELYNTKIKRFNYFYPYLNLSKEAKKNLDLVGGNIFSFSMFFTLLFKKNLHLVHLHTAKRFGSIARLVCKLRKIPYVVTVHGGVFNRNEQLNSHLDLTSNAFEWGKVLGFIFGSRRVYEDANAVICLNKEEFEKMKMKNSNTFFLPNSIDVKSFQNQKNVNSRFTFLISARIDKQKNQLLALKAFKALANKQSMLYIVGNITDESYYNLLKEYVKKNSLQSRVKFFTNLKPNSKELLQIYSSCDAMILPSIHEPFGLVVLEAWASSLPVILSDIAGITSAVEHTKNALVFKSESLNSLRVNMSLLINNQTLQQTLSSNGFRTVQEFDDKKIALKIVQIYKRSFI